jgi:hypothetical protein
VAFLFNTASYDYAWAAEIPGRGVDMPDGSGVFKELNADTFTLPEYLGHIKDQYKATNPNKTIIHIQDAHCNYAAQRRIAEIVEYLNKEYGISIINLEGGARDYDLSVFTGIRDMSIREKTADYFVKEGLVNGAEYFAINNPGKISLWGIEDTKLYVDNLRVYRDSLKYKAEVDRHLKTLEHILNNLKIKIYSPELLELDTKYSQYKANTLKFKDYLAYLIKAANNRNIDVRGFKNIRLLNQALEAEGKIDFKQANIQRDGLIERLHKKISKKAIEELTAKSIEFRSEKISQKEFYSCLEKKAKDKGIPVSEFMELEKYIGYVMMFDAIDKAKVIEEIDTLESKARETLCRNDDERQLCELSKNLSLLKNIFSITLTKDDYKYYEANEASFDAQNFVNFIERNAPLYKISSTLDDNIQDLDKYRREITQFYEFSLKRDDAFLNNLRMASSGKQAVKASILLTGGFHTENLAELFKKQGISYISIMPGFKNAEGYNCPYFGLLSGTITGPYKMLSDALGISTSGMMVASLENALGKEVWGERNIDAYKAMVGLKAILGDDVERIQRFERNGEALNVHIEGKVEPRPVPIWRLFYQAGEVIDEKMASGVFMPIEALDPSRIKAIAMARVLGEQVKEGIDNLETGAERIDQNGDRYKLMIQESSGLGDVQDEHAGGWGVSIRQGLEGDKKTEAILHGIVAGFVESHKDVDNIVKALMPGGNGVDKARELFDVAEKHKVDGKVTALWDMTQYQRQARARKRDFATTTLTATAESSNPVSLIDPKSISTGKEFADTINRILEQNGFDLSMAETYRRVAYSGLHILAQYKDYFDSGGVLLMRDLEEVCNLMSSEPSAWADAYFNRFKRCIAIIPTVRNPHDELFKEINLTEEQFNILLTCGYKGEFNLQLTRGCGGQCLHCAVRSEHGKMQHIPFPVVVKILKRVENRRIRLLTYFNTDPANYHDKVINATAADVVEIARSLGYAGYTFTTYPPGVSPVVAGELSKVKVGKEISFHIFRENVANYCVKAISSTDDAALQKLARAHGSIKKAYSDLFVSAIKSAIASESSFNIRRYVQNELHTDDESLSAHIRREAQIIRGSYPKTMAVIERLDKLQEEVWRDVKERINRECGIDLNKRDPMGRRSYFRDTVVIWTDDAASWLMELVERCDLSLKRDEHMGAEAKTHFESILKQLQKDELFEDQFWKASVVESDFSVLLRPTWQSNGYPLSAMLQVKEGYQQRYRTVREMFNREAVLRDEPQNDERDRFVKFLNCLKLVMGTRWGDEGMPLDELPANVKELVLDEIQRNGFSVDLNWRIFGNSTYSKYLDILSAFFIDEPALRMLLNNRKENLESIYDMLSDVPFPTNLDFNAISGDYQKYFVLGYSHYLDQAHPANTKNPYISARYFELPVRVFGSRMSTQAKVVQEGMPLTERIALLIERRRWAREVQSEYAIFGYSSQDTTIPANINKQILQKIAKSKKMFETWKSSFLQTANAILSILGTDAAEHLLTVQEDDLDYFGFFNNLQNSNLHKDVVAALRDFLGGMLRHDQGKQAEKWIRDRFEDQLSLTKWTTTINSACEKDADAMVAELFIKLMIIARNIFPDDIMAGKSVFTMIGKNVANSCYARGADIDAMLGSGLRVGQLFLDKVVQKVPEKLRFRYMVFALSHEIGHCYVNSISDIKYSYTSPEEGLADLFGYAVLEGMFSPQEVKELAIYLDTIENRYHGPYDAVNSLRSDILPPSYIEASVPIDDGFSVIKILRDAIGIFSRNSKIELAEFVKELKRVNVENSNGEREALAVARLEEIWKGISLDSTNGYAHGVSDANLSVVASDETYRAWLVNWIKEKFGANISILSIGSGRGHLELALQEAGFKVKAIEQNEELAKESTAKGVDTVTGSIGSSETFSSIKEKYDLVLFSECLGCAGLSAIGVASAFVKDAGHIIITDYSYTTEVEAQRIRRLVPYNRISPELMRVALIRGGFDKDIEQMTKEVPGESIVLYSATKTTSGDGGGSRVTNWSKDEAGGRLTSSLVAEEVQVSTGETLSPGAHFDFGARLALVRETADKAKGVQAIQGILRICEALPPDERAEQEMALRTAVMVDGLSTYDKTGHVNIVAQITKRGQSTSARRPIQELAKKLDGFPYGLYAQSIIGEVDDSSSLCELIERIVSAVKVSKDPSAHALLMLPEYLYEDSRHDYYAEAKNIFLGYGIDIDAEDARVRIQKVEQWDNPDLVSQFGLGFQITEYMRALGENKDAEPGEGLLNLIAAMVDGPVDSQIVRNILFKGILKIRKINWGELSDRQKAWEAVAQAA